MVFGGSGAMLDFVTQIFSKMFAIYSQQIPIIVALAILFSVLTVFESQTSSKGKVWWRNPGLPTDMCYALTNSLIVPYLKYPLLIVIVLAMSGSMSPDQIADYFNNGRGPLSELSFWWQAAIYLLLSDFLLYWIHRGFHTVSMWRFHAIHHSATEVDWTTTYRFHPVNLMLQPALVGIVMIALGVSPKVMAFFLPWDILSAAFVHANVNWSFGPLKYIIATPVFHRWHHGPINDGGSSNFAPTFSFFDLMFGTFHMPEGRLPQDFGLDDHHFPQTYVGQLVYPFAKQTDVAPEASVEAGAQAT
jgi:sterol desaturase/sphingolipid hydroxylase (fatty acid hydroxylase superfamily)